MKPKGGRNNSSAAKSHTHGSSGSVFDDLNDAPDVPCGICKKMIGDSASIECDRCTAWVHYKCSDLVSAEYECIRQSKNKAIKWFCSKCMSDQGQSSDPGDRFASTEAKLAALMGIVEVMQSQNKLILSLLQNSGDRINEEVTKQIKDYFEDEKEKEARKNNLIFFNIPETGKTGEEETCADKP